MQSLARISALSDIMARESHQLSPMPMPEHFSRVFALLALLLTCSASSALAHDSRCAPGPTTPGYVEEFQVPTPNAHPLGIAAGPDCAMWFTEGRANQIGRISVTGQITEYPIPTPGSNPARITRGPDGAMWFTESRGNKIGRITTSGVITEFPIPTPNSFPVGITTGPDGNIWFTEQGGRKIGRITPAGVITEFAIPPEDATPSLPLSIVAGADGNVWFTEYFTGRVGRVTRDGAITMFIIEPACCADLGEITAGPDGNLWFGDRWENTIWRMSPFDQSKRAFRLLTPGFSQRSISAIYGITFGADHAIWYTDDLSSIGRMTVTGSFSQHGTPTPDSSPELIAAGPDGNIWFTEGLANRIGRIGVAPVVHPVRIRQIRR